MKIKGNSTIQLNVPEDFTGASGDTAIITGKLFEEDSLPIEGKVINLEVRETQLRAIQLYEQAGYVRSGINPKSVFIDGKYIAGYYYYKELK